MGSVVMTLAATTTSHWTLPLPRTGRGGSSAPSGIAYSASSRRWMCQMEG